jgi:penicillin-binding protein 1A
MGITPELVTGVWTGAEDRAIHFSTTSFGEGANTALPIFAIYMQKVYADATLKYTKDDFPPPKGGISTVIDCGEYSKQQSGVSELDKKLGF